MVNHVAMSEMTSELKPVNKYEEKMEITRITEACDEREEGEIIEDDLEDVSDSSMFPNSPVDSGKSVSPELLSAVCLSSVSSTDYCRPSGRNYFEGSFCYNTKWKQRRKRKNFNFKRRNNYLRQRKRVSVEVQSESDNELVDPKYAKQLKEALKHETPQELHNSLRTRLKAFIDPSSPHSDEDSITALHNMSLLPSFPSTSTPNHNDIPTPEVVNKNLIVENFEDSELYELRMAALKSVVLEKHKNRKRKKGDCIAGVSPGDVDKENDQSIINNDVKSQDSGVEEPVNKEIDVQEPLPEHNANDNDNVMEEDVDILRAMLLASMTKTLSTKFPESTNTVNLITKNKDTPRTEHMKTLAKHAIVNPLIINVNDDSDTDLENLCEENKSFKDTVTEFLKKQRAEVENVKKTETLNKSDDFMDKSVMRLLPKSQQLEYRQLKQRLLNARKKTRLRRVSQRISENTTLVKKVPKVKIVVDVPGSTNPATNVNGKVKNTQELKNLQPNLQKTLNELQIRKNGRLQMKGKYRPLGVLLHKINHASNVRRQHELEIKKLLHEIQKARVKLAMSHQNFTSLVQQLIKEKQAIDQSVYKSSIPFTSTPKSTVNKQLNKSNNIQETSSTNTVNNQVETAKTEEENVLLEPNDVNKVFIQQADVLKYTSPLDNRDRNEFNDPLTTICPYDLLGTCKDKECKYMHCS